MMYSVADPRGEGTPPLSDQNFLNFMQFFWKIWQICILTPPSWRVGAPSYGKSWIRPWYYITKGHTQTGIPFMCALYVYWKMVAYQNVTPVDVCVCTFKISPFLRHKTFHSIDLLQNSCVKNKSKQA